MKKYLLYVLIQLATWSGYAQVDSAQQELDQIFQYIDKSQIPTGYLNEYGADVVYKKWFNGTLTDSNFVLGM